MNKKIIFLSLTLAAIFATGFTVIQASKDICNPVKMKNLTAAHLKPYTYDSAKLNRIQLTKKPQKFTTEVPLSLFGSYRIVFNSVGMPKKIGVNVYNKDRDASKRELLFSNADSLETNTELIYNIKKHTMRVFIDYDVPADTLNLKIKGCMYFMVGYK